MKDIETIHRGFEALRTLCDPRGHELLDALEEYLIATTMQANLLGFAWVLSEAKEVSA